MNKPIVLVIFVLISISALSQNYNVDFFSACENGDIAKVKKFLDARIDLNQKDNNGNTALMVASRPFNFDIIKLLVESGAGLNQVNVDGKTALTLLYTRLWETNDYDREKNIWETYLYLRSKGAKEQDYVDFITRNLSGNDAFQQEKVLEIKKTYTDFNKNLKLYKLKKFHEKDSTIDGMTYAVTKGDYQARYDASGKLAFFEYQFDDSKDWGDNGSRESWTKQYFFKNGNLYFYFEDYSFGFNPTLEQYRIYIDKGEAIITAYKYFDNFYGAFPKEMRDINNFINIKCDNDKKPSVKKIQEDLDKIYQEVKDKLE